MDIESMFIDAYEKDNLNEMISLQDKWLKTRNTADSDANFYGASAIVYGLVCTSSDNPLVYKLMLANFENLKNGNFKPEKPDLYEWFLSAAETVVSKVESSK